MKNTDFLKGYAEGYRKGKQDHTRGCTGCKWEDMNGIGCSQCARKYFDQFEPMEVERP